MTDQHASSRSRNPAPPASTTPACASTGNISGVRARASAAAPWAPSTTPTSVAPPRPAPAAAPSAAAEATVRIVPSTGRTTARRARSEACASASARMAPSTPASPAAAHALAHAPQELGEDHARVAPGPHERAVADGPAHLGQRRTGRHTVELGHHGLERQRHVGAGVAVGHRIDVQAVDVRLMLRAAHPGSGPSRHAARLRPRSPGRSWQGMLTFAPFVKACVVRTPRPPTGRSTQWQQCAISVARSPRSA